MTVSAALTPRLTALDQRVLAVLLHHTGRRAARIAQLLLGRPAWRCDTCGAEDVVSHLPAPRAVTWMQAEPRRCWHPIGPAVFCETGRMAPVLLTTAEQVAEVRQVLRGLERVGLASCRGGWWRAT